MKRINLLICSTLLATALNATDTQTQINFEQDSDGNINPNIFVPIELSDDSYFGIGYTSSTSKTIGALNSFSDSKTGLVSTKKDMKVNWYTKKIANYSIGLQTNHITIENNEFGYIHDTADVFGKGNDYWIAFDNSVELDIVKTSIYMDWNKKYSDLHLRLSSTISPMTTLKVKQSTLFKPLVDTVGTNSSSDSQGLGYGLKLESFYDTDSLLKLGFLYSYDFSPVKYDIAQLAKSGSNYIFETATIDTEEVTTKYLFKLYIERNVLGGLIPTIGFGSATTDIKDKVSGKTVSEDNDIISFGFEKKF